MSDTNALVLKVASDAILEIEMRYRSVSIDEKEVLKPARDKALSDYTAARLKLLKGGVITTKKDLKEMKEIRAQIEKAAVTQTLIIAAIKSAGFFRKLAGI